jgi:prevent-host-death family protein
MVGVDAEYAQAHLRELLDKVDAGQKVVIFRHGRAVAHLVPASASMRSIPVEELAAFRATMPRLRQSSTVRLRKVRDEGL